MPLPFISLNITFIIEPIAFAISGSTPSIGDTNLYQICSKCNSRHENPKHDIKQHLVTYWEIITYLETFLFAPQAEEN